MTTGIERAGALIPRSLPAIPPSIAKRGWCSNDHDCPWSNNEAHILQYLKPRLWTKFAGFL